MNQTKERVRSWRSLDPKELCERSQKSLRRGGRHSVCQVPGFFPGFVEESSGRAGKSPGVELEIE